MSSSKKMGWKGDTMESVRSMQIRQALTQAFTLGGNNYEDDRRLYAQGQLWLQRHHIMGRAVGFLPYVGRVTIIMAEKPIIKYILIGAMGLLVITSKD